MATIAAMGVCGYVPDGQPAGTNSPVPQRNEPQGEAGETPDNANSVLPIHILTLLPV